ncbi:MAG: hypothetical protein AB1796_12905 [Bacillota bacterium]
MLAGLLAGKELLRDEVKIVPVDVGLATPDYRERIALLAGDGHADSFHDLVRLVRRCKYHRCGHHLSP